MMHDNNDDDDDHGDDDDDNNDDDDDDDDGKVSEVSGVEPIKLVASTLSKEFGHGHCW